MMVDNINMPSTDGELRSLMRGCEQTKGMSVLQHGLSVARYYKELVDHLTLGKPLSYNWRLPEWVYSSSIIDSLLDSKTVLLYLLYHDCGKPLCAYIDDEGRRHFPDHANHSYELWKSMYGDGDVAWLMKHDMDIHLARVKDVPQISSTKYWATQLLSGLAELHSNASMFGGIDSVSFKIKYKNLDKVGKRLIEHKMDSESL